MTNMMLVFTLHPSLVVSVFVVEVVVVAVSVVMVVVVTVSVRVVVVEVQIPHCNRQTSFILNF